MGAGLIAAAVALAAAAPPPQLEVQVRAEAPWFVPHRDVEVELVQRSASGGVVREQRLVVPVGGSRLVAGEAGAWVEARVVSAGVWAPGSAVRVEGGGARVVLLLRPTRVVHLRAAWDGGEPPEAVRVMFSSPPPPGEQAAPSLAGEVWGRLQEDDGVVVQLPAGRWDVRVSALDRAPVYLWDVDLTAAAHKDLGRLVLRRAASVSGFVVGPDGRPLAEGATVTLLPVISDVALENADVQRLQGRRRTVPVGERGFFQVVGVEEGVWQVQASAPGYLSAAVSPVEVVAGAESRLEEPLRLTTPVPVRVTVSPPRDPWGGELTVHVTRPHGEVVGRVQEQRASGVVNEHGVWESQLGEGAYQLEVRSAAGVWWHQEVEVRAPVAEVEVTLALVEVEGTVRRGRQRLAARVCFEAEQGRWRVCNDADAQGRYHTFLPSPGRWGVAVEGEGGRIFWRVVAVKSEKPVRVDVELPDTRLAGVVVLESGAGVAGARVRATPLGSGVADVGEFAAVSQRDGRFLLEGLPEGPWHLVATTAAGPSDGVVASVAAGRDGEEVRLVVRERVTVRGRVLAAGVGVPGAQVVLSPQCFSSGVSVAISAQGTTDVAGRFAVDVAAPCGRATATVFALGHAAAVRRVAVGGGEELVVSLELRGGTLLLAGGEPGWERRHVLVHQGGTVAVASLLPWATRHGGGLQGAQLRIPALEPGLWAVCPASLLPRLELLPSHATAFPQGCISALLPPGGIASVALPEVGER